MEAELSEAEQVLLAWLKRHGPDDWHQVSIDWNWDAGVQILAWIAAQSECDRATAQNLIVIGGADYYLRFADRAALLAAEPYNLEAFDLIMPIIARWNAGGYDRSEIASYEPAGLTSQRRRHRAAEDALGHGHLPFRLADDVFEPLEGRVYSYLYTEGWPPEVEAELRSRGLPY
jgi:hypothetical protein